MTLLDWAIKHRIPASAMQDLCLTCLHLAPPEAGQSESALQQQLRLEGARLGKYLFRNNRGAGRTDSGTYVRWGLANDSKGLGDAVKSADLIGFERVTITPEMVGSYIARFLSVEVKAADWKYHGTLEEIAQIKWATLINYEGGRAIITNKLGVL
jgi:hypothetical protein